LTGLTAVSRPTSEAETRHNPYEDPSHAPNGKEPARFPWIPADASPASSRTQVTPQYEQADAFRTALLDWLAAT